MTLHCCAICCSFPAGLTDLCSKVVRKRQFLWNMGARLLFSVKCGEHLNFDSVFVHLFLGSLCIPFGNTLFSSWGLHLLLGNFLRATCWWVEPESEVSWAINASGPTTRLYPPYRPTRGIIGVQGHSLASQMPSRRVQSRAIKDVAMERGVLAWGEFQGPHGETWKSAFGPWTKGSPSLLYGLSPGYLRECLLP